MGVQLANGVAARIVKRADLTPRVWKIWLEPEGPFAFKPGQYCTIGVDGIERPYSIASAPHEPLIELFIKLIPHPLGVLTPILYAMDEESEVRLRPRAKGLFALDGHYRRHLMVSTGTGIAPFVSMVRDHLACGRATGAMEFHILQGTDCRYEFGYDRELAELASRHPEIHYTPTLGLPQAACNEGWRESTGWVNLIVEDYIREQRLDPGSTLVYVCGHPGMIANVKGRLLPRGWGVKEERFWKPEDDEEGGMAQQEEGSSMTDSGVGVLSGSHGIRQRELRGMGRRDTGDQ